MKLSLAIIIPAAGRSERFGKAKQLLQWGPSTLLENCIERSLKLNPAICLVLTGAYREEVEKSCRNKAIEFSYVDDWENGMGRSIAHGISQVMNGDKKINAVLVLLPDQPTVTLSHLQRMLDSLREDDLVATCYEGGVPGVPALITKPYFERLRKLDADKGARAFFNEYPDKLTMIEPDFLPVDIDTPDDYEKLRDKIEG